MTTIAPSFASTANYQTSNCRKVNFRGAEPAQETAAPAKKSGKWGKAIASFFMTGLGQFCDGRVGDGFKQMGTAIGLGIVARVAMLAGLAAKSPVGKYLGFGTAAAAGVGVFANGIYSIVDAYKGGKK